MIEIEEAVEKLEEKIDDISAKVEELDAMVRREGNRVKCPNCSYGWYSRSKLLLVSCPNCGNKVKFTDASQNSEVDDQL